LTIHASNLPTNAASGSGDGLRPNAVTTEAAAAEWEEAVGREEGTVSSTLLLGAGRPMTQKKQRNKTVNAIHLKIMFSSESIFSRSDFNLITYPVFGDHFVPPC
jgi:hypothetical protein